MEQKKILLIVCGGIAAYKAADVCSRLTKRNCEVRVIMTRHATEFIAPLTLETLSGHPVLCDQFGGEDPLAHINLNKWADLVLVVPCTANLLAKAACGIADDLVSSTLLANCGKPVLACPAMNVHMFENPATQRNCAQLRADGWHILEPAVGMLACHDAGKGKLPDPDTIVAAMEGLLVPAGFLSGKKVLVTAGPTREALDPVRFLSNRSTGRQGYAIAAAARDLGADVTLVSGPVSLSVPDGVSRVSVESAREMFEAVKAHADADYFILSAAVSDFRPESAADHKIKKDKCVPEVKLVPNPDILAWLGKHKKSHQVLCGFAMETENLEAQGRSKLVRKNCDLLVANNLFDPGAGFAGQTNKVLLLFPDRTEDLPLLSKYDLGVRILKAMKEMDDAGCH